MKKLFVLLLALSCVGFAFAEDAAAPAPVSAVTGYYYNQVKAYDQDGNAALGPSWVSAGQYANLGVSYAAPEYGFSATIEYENNAVNSAFRDYTAWAKPFGSFAKFSAGKLRNGDYRLTSYIDGTGFNSRLANAEYGFMAQVYPIDGLSIGIFDYVPADGIKFAIGNLDFGASYKIGTIGTVYAAAKRNPSVVTKAAAATAASVAWKQATAGITEAAAITAGYVNSSTGLAWAAGDGAIIVGQWYGVVTAAKAAVTQTTVDTDEYFVGFNLAAVEGLTAKVGATFDLTANVAGKANNNKWTKIWATAGYALLDKKLDLGFDGYFLMNSGTELYAKVNAAYTMEKIVPSAYFNLTNVSGYTPNTTKADGVTALTAAAGNLDAKQAGTALGFGFQLKVPAGANGAVYTGIDFSKDGTVNLATDALNGGSAVDTLTWSIPLTVEVSF